MDFKQIFERQSDRVYRLAYLYLKNAPDAEDAVQNIFVKYISRPVDFESDSHENAWFITVTRNYCKDFFRSFWRKN
ncbi:MAG: sigma-70 family RNA polymerase sigma factor, partial [Clostridia bacterium]|nr:sigma-70 family RNA polymerase sigma factor [Clostridia bacterium]